MINSSCTSLIFFDLNDAAIFLHMETIVHGVQPCVYGSGDPVAAPLLHHPTLPTHSAVIGCRGPNPPAVPRACLKGQSPTLPLVSLGEWGATRQR